MLGQALAARDIEIAGGDLAILHGGQEAHGPVFAGDQHIGDALCRAGEWEDQCSSRSIGTSGSTIRPNAFTAAN